MQTYAVHLLLSTIRNAYCVLPRGKPMSWGSLSCCHLVLSKGLSTLFICQTQEVLNIQPTEPGKTLSSAKPKPAATYAVARFERVTTGLAFATHLAERQNTPQNSIFQKHETCLSAQARVVICHPASCPSRPKPNRFPCRCCRRKEPRPPPVWKSAWIAATPGLCREA